MRRRAIAAACLLAAGLLSGPAAGQSTKPTAKGRPSVPPPKIRFETNALMECHYYLKTYSGASVQPPEGSGVDLSTEVSAYSRARSTIEDKDVWRWFEEQVAEGPDPAAVRELAKSLPPKYDSPRNQTGVNMLTDGLESAYPKFSKTIWPIHQRSLNRTVIGARKRFMPGQDRVSEVLMGTMGFSPIDAPISIITVIRAGGVATWGKTSRGYFTVVGTVGQSQLTLLETGIHEATHIIEALQPFSSADVIRSVRRGLASRDPGALDTFIHGLITYNAGALVSRFVSSSYVPTGIRAPAHVSDYQPYLSTYEFIWREYLDGKMSRDAIVAKLIEEFDAVQEILKEREKAGGD